MWLKTLKNELFSPTRLAYEHIYKLRCISRAAPVPSARQMTPYWIDALDLFRCGEGTARTNS